MTQYEIIHSVRMQNFPKNYHFLPTDMHTSVCVSGGKECYFFGKICIRTEWMIPIYFSKFLKKWIVITCHWSILPENIRKALPAPYFLILGKYWVDCHKPKKQINQKTKFWTKLIQKVYFRSKTRHMNITTEFSILELV